MVVEVAEVAVKEEDIRSIVIQISIIALRIEALFGFILWLNPLTARRGGFVKNMYLDLHVFSHCSRAIYLMIMCDFC